MVIIKTRPVIGYVKEPFCECGSMLKYVNEVDTVPVSYQYKCPSCGNTALLGVKYPIVVADDSESKVDSIANCE